VALFPLHGWQPDAYDAAPDDVTAVLAALVSTVAAYALFRVVTDVFTTGFLLGNETVRTLALAAALASVLAGSLLAVRQARVARMLAYSSVSQFGLVVTGLLLVSETAAFGAVVHLVGHAVVKAGLFLAVGALAARTGARLVEDYDGLAARAPVHAALFGVLAATLVGVPPTVGFAGKWFIALGAAETGAWGVVAVILASTLLTLTYVVRLLERMYGPLPTPGAGDAAETSADTVATDGGVAGLSRAPRARDRFPVGDARWPIAVTAAAAVALGLGVGALQSFVAPALAAALSAGVIG
jgi:multicomponent Na+:H+ antiporter subunit D